MGSEQDMHWIRSFPSFHKLLFQDKAQCKVIDRKVIFHSHENETHFHNEDFGTQE